MKDDVKGVFRHTKYYLDIVSAFRFQILDLMYVYIEDTFGSISSPSNFEPLVRTRVWLARHISRDNTLVKNHWNIIQNLKISKRPDKEQNSFNQNKILLIKVYLMIKVLVRQLNLTCSSTIVFSSK